MKLKALLTTSMFVGSMIAMDNHIFSMYEEEDNDIFSMYASSITNKKTNTIITHEEEENPYDRSFYEDPDEHTNQVLNKLALAGENCKIFSLAHEGNDANDYGFAAHKNSNGLNMDSGVPKCVQELCKYEPLGLKKALIDFETNESAQPEFLQKIRSSVRNYLFKNKLHPDQYFNLNISNEKKKLKSDEFKKITDLTSKMNQEISDDWSFPDIEMFEFEDNDAGDEMRLNGLLMLEYKDYKKDEHNMAIIRGNYALNKKRCDDDMDSLFDSFQKKQSDKKIGHALNNDIYSKSTACSTFIPRWPVLNSSTTSDTPRFPRFGQTMPHQMYNLFHPKK